MYWPTFLLHSTKLKGLKRVTKVSPSAGFDWAREISVNPASEENNIAGWLI